MPQRIAAECPGHMEQPSFQKQSIQVRTRARTRPGPASREGERATSSQSHQLSLLRTSKELWKWLLNWDDDRKVPEAGHWLSPDLSLLLKVHPCLTCLHNASRWEVCAVLRVFNTQTENLNVCRHGAVPGTSRGQQDHRDSHLAWSLLQGATDTQE